MHWLRKNRAVFLIVLAAAFLMLMVTWIYEDRIQEIEKKFPAQHDTSGENLTGTATP